MSICYVTVHLERGARISSTDENTHFTFWTVLEPSMVKKIWPLTDHTFSVRESACRALRRLWVGGVRSSTMTMRLARMARSASAWEVAAFLFLRKQALIERLERRQITGAGGSPAPGSVGEKALKQASMQACWGGTLPRSPAATAADRAG